MHKRARRKKPAGIAPRRRRVFSCFLISAAEDLAAVDVGKPGRAAHGHRGFELAHDLVHVDLIALRARAVDGGEDGAADQLFILLSFNSYSI